MAPTTKKTAASTSKSKATASAAHPSFQTMIVECIKGTPEESRGGVSRPIIKKFLADKYKLDMSSATNITHLNKAITRGAEANVFDLPKGIGGKVKLVKKEKASAGTSAAKPAAGKENAPPKKAPTSAAKKAAPSSTKKAAAKPASKAAPAKAAAAKPAAKKAAAPTAKKAAAPAKKAPAAKKTTTKKAPAVKAKAAPAKKAPAKKTAAKK